MYRLLATIGPAFAAVALLYVARSTFTDLLYAFQNGSTREDREVAILQTSEPTRFWNYVAWTILLLAIQAGLTICALAILTDAVFNGEHY